MIIALDINGVLCIRYYSPDGNITNIPNGIVCGNHVIVLRPYLQEFLKYCFKYHTVGIYTCITKYNIFKNLNAIFTYNQRKQLAFIIHRGNMGEDKTIKSIDMVHNMINVTDDVLIIDDTESKVNSNPEGTYLVVEPYNPDINTDDTVLLDIITMLKNKEYITNKM